MTGPGLELAELTEPWAATDTDELGHGWARLAAAIGLQFAEQWAAVREDPATGDEPWEVLLDPTRAPGWALEWQAQLSGTTLPPRLDDAQRRLLLAEANGLAHGTERALERIVRLRTPGALEDYVQIRWRTDPFDPGADRARRLHVLTHRQDTPDIRALLRDLQASKPARVRLRYELLLGRTYGELAGFTYGEGEAQAITAESWGGRPELSAFTYGDGEAARFTYGELAATTATYDDVSYFVAVTAQENARAAA